MMKSKKGLTLMEIIISAVILGLIMAGMVNIFVSGKRYVLHNRARMTGGEIGKLFIDPLQMYVRETEEDPANNSSNGWDVNNSNNPLGSSNNTTPALYYCDNSTNTQLETCPSNSARALNHITYNATYKISNVSINATKPPDLRKVVTEISWNEPSS